MLIDSFVAWGHDANAVKHLFKREKLPRTKHPRTKAATLKEETAPAAIRLGKLLNSFVAALLKCGNR